MTQTIRINGTSYKVQKLETSKGAGIVGNYSVEGPRSSRFFVTDYGPKFHLVSVSVTGWPRPLKGLKREHLASLGVEV